jgi:hypothetical protein
MMLHIIPLKDGDKKAPDLVCIFLRDIWRHQAIPSTITSDRDTRFTSTIWKGIVDTLGTKSKMSSPFHHQTDGQTQSLNQALQCDLRNYCNYEQDNLEDMLLMAEYAYNNALHSTVKMTPFFANYGYIVQTNWPTAEPSRNTTSPNNIQWMTSVYQLCVQELEKASKTMRKYHDKSQTCTSIPTRQFGHSKWKKP